MEIQPQILIFKTNIQTCEQKEMIGALLDKHTQIVSWTIDQEDEDCVLRVVGLEISIHEVVALVNAQHMACSELR